MTCPKCQQRFRPEQPSAAELARTFERLSELQVGFETVLLAALRGELTGDPDQQFSERVVAEADQLSEKARRRLAKALAPQSAGRFDSHPSPTERISAVSRRPHAGIFQLEGPAICLLNTSALSRDRSRGG